MLVALIALWVALLIFGFGLILWGMRDGIAPGHVSLGSALYFAGTSVLTIGFGDIVARAPGPRLVSVLCALAGLSFLSITTAFLFAVFGSFQQRETFVVTTAARAGAPPNGVNLLAIAGYSETREDLPALMMDAQHWAAMRDGEPFGISRSCFFPFESRRTIVGRHARHAARRGHVDDDDRRGRARRPGANLLQRRTPCRAGSFAILSGPYVGGTRRTSNAPSSTTLATGWPRQATPSPIETKPGFDLPICARATPLGSTNWRASFRFRRCNGSATVRSLRLHPMARSSATS